MTMNFQIRPLAQAGPLQRRYFWMDLLKAVACVLIVLHHLAFYGPMSDVLQQQWPGGWVTWLAQDARLAVQVFLVFSGFLMAQSVQVLTDISALAVVRACSRRYLRLAVPLLPALSLTVLLSEWIRPAFLHDSLSAAPSLWQAVAHVFLLQHLLDMQALSAGVWYVAVDFQLYLSALLVAWLAKWLARKLGGSAGGWQLCWVAALTLASLAYWTHLPALEDVALFFWGAYGMGWLARHARTHWTGLQSAIVWLALGGLCVLCDERGRAMTAWGVSVLLLVMPQWGNDLQHSPSVWQRAVVWLSSISYPVFVTHFAVSLWVNAKVSALWPTSVAMNALGMLLALLLSLVVGAVLYGWTERTTPSWRQWLFWTGVFMASAGLAMHWPGGSD